MFCFETEKFSFVQRKFFNHVYQRFSSRNHNLTWENHRWAQIAFLERKRTQKTDGAMSHRANGRKVQIKPRLWRRWRRWGGQVRSQGWPECSFQAIERQIQLAGDGRILISSVCVVRVCLRRFVQSKGLWTSVDAAVDTYCGGRWPQASKIRLSLCLGQFRDLNLRPGCKPQTVD